MKFKKEILKEGFHFVGDGKGGRRAEFIPRTRMEHWTNQHAEMRKLGLNIPAPDHHSAEFKPTTEVTQGSKANYGFWDTLDLEDSVDENGNPIKLMSGYLDTGDHPDSVKIGNSVRETSIYAIPEFLDGKGRVWKDVLSHIACVTQPIEPGQKNFQTVKEGDLAIAMSHRIPVQMDMTSVNNIMSGDEANTEDVFDMLEKVAGIAIARGTPAEEMTKALLNALRQKQLSESNQQDGSLLTPPKNSQVNKVPVVMSANQTPAQVQPIPAPKTEVIPPDQPTVMAQQHAGMLEYVTGQTRQSLSQRLDNLVKRGIVKDETTVTNYRNQIETVQMAFDTANKPILSAIEQTISNLELIRIPMPTDRPIVAMAQQDDAAFVIQQHDTPFISGTNISDEDIKDTVDALFSQIN